MDLRLDVVLSLLTGVGEVAVFVRLVALDAVLRYCWIAAKGSKFRVREVSA